MAIILGLKLGTLISILATVMGITIPSISPLDGGYMILIFGISSMLLLWLFTHDLAHLIVGMTTGVRFNNYYFGLSNVTKLKYLIPDRLKFLFLVLGLRINKKDSTADKRGFAIMYLAGPLASMIFPILVPVIFILRNADYYITLFLLAISLTNFGFSLLFSSKVGCIYKARRTLMK